MNSKTDAGQDGTPHFYECSECGAVFPSKDELDSHMIEIHKAIAG